MAKTGHPNFVYKISSPWRTGRHTWSLTGNHSGSSLSGTAAEDFMLGDDSPFTLSFAPWLTAAGTSGTPVVYTDYAHQLVEAIYYDGSDSAPVFEQIYDADVPAPSNLWPTGTGWLGEIGRALYTSLESCVTMQAEVGLSKTNKPVLVRKFLHGLPSGGSAYNEDGGMSITPTAAGTTALESMNNGSWYGSRVYIARSGNQPAAAAWTVIPGQHQMPRGRRKVSAKAGAAASESLLSLLESGAIGAALSTGIEALL